MPLEISRHTEAVLLVQTGGRIVYHNRSARKLLNLSEGEPNLDRLGRRARPSEVFWGLCAAEGQARFLMDGRVVEGVSYAVPYGTGRAMLVTLRRPQLITDREGEQPTEGAAVHSTQGLGILAEISQAMTSSLDLDTTLRSILESVERLIPADAGEISLWDSEARQLVPYHLIGSAGSERHLETSSEPYAPNQGYTGYLATQRQPLLISDVESYQQEPRSAKNERDPFRSYLGVPLEAAGDLVGLLELHSLNVDAFSENDLGVLRMLSRQAALAIHNALLYEKEEKRVRELTGLAQLAQAVSAQREPQDLYARLVESLSPLFNVETLGFLIYDEERHSLDGQIPFHGLQPSVVEWTHVDLTPGSRAEQVWLTQETIIAHNAPTDLRIQALGLEHLAFAAGIRQTILAPLTSSGRMLGYLQVGDKRDGNPFDQSDMRLVSIVAGQAAAVIENTELVKQSRHRAQRAETLRRIASLTASSATLDEILQYSLQDIARLLQADMGIIFLLDEGRGELRLHKPSLLGIPSDVSVRLGRLPVNDPQFRLTVTGSQKPVLAADILAEPGVLSVYQALAASLQGRSVIVAPLSVRERGVGEMILINQAPGFFQSADLQTVNAAAGQLAGAIERAGLYVQTDESLRQRVNQLTALTRISRELNTTLQLDYVLQRVFDESLHTTRADCGTILLFELDTEEENRSGTRIPHVLLHLGDPPGPELHPLEKQVLETGEALIIEAFDLPSQDEGIPGNHREFLQPAHEGVQSALIVPIAYQEQVAGLIHLHARNPGHFGATDREIAETLAIQAAIAIGNAQRYQEQVRHSTLLSRRVETLAKLFETSQAMQLELPLEQALENIAYAIQAATPFDIVVISVFDAESKHLRRVSSAGLSLADMEELRAHTQAWNALQQVLQPEFRVGHSYFIPYERMPVMPPDVHSLIVQPTNGIISSEDGRPELVWQPEDALVVPLLDVRGEPLGLVSVDAPRDHLRPDRPTIESLEIFASQATLVIESQGKLSLLKEQLDSIQRELKVTRKAAETAQTHLPLLLHKDLEQTLAIHRLSRRAQRIRAGIDIAEMANRQGDRLSVLRALGSELLVRMELDIALVVEPGPRGPQLLHTLGSLPSGVNVEALIGQTNPLQHCLQSGEQLLVPRLDGTPWANAPLLLALDGRGFMCFPVRAAEKIDAAILAVNCTPMEPYTDEDEQVIALLARQVGITLQNMRLLEETSQRLAEVNLLLDFNRRLGGMDPAGILQTLTESIMRLVPASQAVMAALWDEKRHLLLPKGAAGFMTAAPLLEIAYKPDKALPGQIFSSGQSLILDEVDFARHYSLSPEDLLRYRNATGGKLPVSSLALPIQLSPDAQPLGVIVLDNYQAPAAFNLADLGLVASLAQQAALNLENTRLVQAAEERASQLQALTGVAATITSNLRPEDLVAMLLDLLITVLPFDTGTLWLRQGDKQVVVRAARGFADEEERLGLVAAVEDSVLLSDMIATSLPISVGDIRSDMRFLSLVEPQYLSWLGVPLIASGEVIGVIALEKIEAGFYTPERVQIATTFAGQAAVSLENARLYQESLSRTQELDQRSQRLEMLNRLSAALSASLEPEHILQVAIEELARALQCSGVSAVMFGDDSTAFLQAEVPQAKEALPLSLPEAPLFERLRQTLGVFNTEDVIREAELLPLLDFLEKRGAHSLLALSLSAGSQAQGVLLAYTDRPVRFNAEEVGLARTITNQASIAIQNARLYAQTLSLSQDLERRVIERTAQFEKARLRTETLLRIITELTSSLDLEQVLNRTLQQVNKIVDAGQITVLISRPDEKKLHRLASLGYAGSPRIGGKTTPFTVDQGLAGWVISARQSALIEDVLQDPRWILLTDVPQPQHRSAMAVPLMVGEECLGVLLLYHPEVGHFSADHLDLVQAAANQVAVAINNAELYRLIRDQAEDLGGMFRRQQVEASRSRAILEAVADGVLVTDPNKNITLFNASAEEILGLDRSQVIGKSLDHFIGLFGSAGQRWSETIRTWSQDPSSYQPGQLYAEQITLEDGRVVSVHLSPASMRESFLGTVSTFRDVSQQVQLDRLKSEFVATVSHELRTPMTSIKGYVDILLMGAAGSLNDKQAEFLEIVRSNSERLAVLVNDLLDISRIESGRVTLSLQPLDMEEMAVAAVDEMRSRSEKDRKPMDIQVKSATGLPRALGDLERVRQVLDNLLENSYYYTPPDGRITVRIQQASEMIQVDIQDSGIGIPLEAQPRIFERFYRGEHPFILATSGTGLGLSIVRHLVEMHNGRIWFESKGIPGDGSTFSFTLPVYRVGEPASQQINESAIRGVDNSAKIKSVKQHPRKTVHQ